MARSFYDAWGEERPQGQVNEAQSSRKDSLRMADLAQIRKRLNGD
jgi:hypothetical protein